MTETNKIEPPSGSDAANVLAALRTRFAPVSSGESQLFKQGYDEIFTPPSNRHFPRTIIKTTDRVGVNFGPYADDPTRAPLRCIFIQSAEGHEPHFMLGFKRDGSAYPHIRDMNLFGRSGLWSSHLDMPPITPQKMIAAVTGGTATP